ncbi:MAG TPA: diguanylate cyclase [Parvibaculum sp.]
MSIDSLDARPKAMAKPAADYEVRVLLVDDQAMVGEAVRRMLADQPDMTFHYCADPAGAVAMAKEIAPTVILQDLVMPGVEGFDLLRLYRADETLNTVPVIVLSTKEEATVKSAAFREGASDYLVKLPDKIELIARIRHHSESYLNRLQRDAAYRELQRLTNVDGLTGLSNRRYFDEYAEVEWQRAMRAQSSLAVLMIDVDHFKQYNDTYGHLAGDEVLKNVAGTLGRCCRRSTDLAARFGGEEFVIILPATPPADVLQFGKELCEAVEALRLPHRASSVGPHLTISVGAAATVPARGSPFSSLLDMADKALYEAKESGRNRAVMRASER